MGDDRRAFQRKIDDFRDELEQLPMGADPRPDGGKEIAVLHTLIRRYPDQARWILDRLDEGLDV